MNKWTPTRKVVTGGVTAQLAAVSSWALLEFARVEIPPYIAVSAAGLLITFIQYVVPDK